MICAVTTKQAKAYDMGENKTIWAFDLGTGSIGEAVRDGTKFLHKASLLIPAEFAETKTAAGRRRMWRTRLAHHAREVWLDEVMLKAGIEPLKGRRTVKIDGKWQAAPEIEQLKRNRERLEREFAEPGDYTCYTSCLLRIKMLRGEKLEPWQVYKALHSAIQRRGYDPDIPWKTRTRSKPKAGGSEDDEAATQARMEEFERQLENMAPGKPAFQFPCYFDAWKMGLWNPSDPAQLKSRIDCRCETTRNQIVPRKLVEKEIRNLVDAAAKYYPKLEGQADYLLYGPAKTAYASFDGKLRKQYNLKEGGANDWQGVLGQKIPRFENRILNDCALIPRLHVCRNPSREEYKKLSEDKLLPAQVTFLMKLKNMRVEEKMPERKQRGLKAAQIKEIFDEYDPKRKYSLTPTQWRNWCEKFAVIPVTDASEKGKGAGEEAGDKKKKEEKNIIEAPADSGRSRFSRPALRILKTLILSGLNPSEMHKKLLQRDTDMLAEIEMDILDSLPIKEKKDASGKLFENYEKQPRPWLLVSDLPFLLAMRKTGAKVDSWEDLFIPNQRLDQLVQEISGGGSADAKAERQRRDKAIQELIGSQNDPKVRHRLATFWERLQFLEKEHGDPSQIVLEFIRVDFMGQKAKSKLKKFQEERADSRKKARGHGGLKFELYQAQSGVCLYGKQVFRDGKCVCLENGLPMPGTQGWDTLVIDHIVPREAPYNGPDAMVNYVLTTPDANNAKRKRTPFDWFHQDRMAEWDGYRNFVTSKIGTLGGKKVQLLTRSNAAELVGKYTSLAETAWIAKLAQTLIRLHFGWPLEHERGKERVTVVPGGLTGRIRRKYLLNTLLDERFKNLPTNQIKPEDEEEAEKDRKDLRHHGLDAMLISFFPDWMRNPLKGDFFRFPLPLDQPFPGKRNKHAVREFFKKQLDEVLPENLFLEKAKLAEMAYGRSFQPEETEANGEMVKYKKVKLPLAELAFRKDSNGKATYDYKHARRAAQGISDEGICASVEAFLKKQATEAEWSAFCQKFETELASQQKRGKTVKIQVRKVEEIRTRRRSVKEMAYEQGNSREYDVTYARENVNEILEDLPEQKVIKAKLRAFFAGTPSDSQWKAFAETLKPIDRCKLRSEFDEGGKKSKARTVNFLVFAHRPIPMKFNLEKAQARIDKICDEHVRQRLRAFVNQNPPPDQAAWNAFCDSFAQERKDENGNPLSDASGHVLYGAAIKKVRVNDGSPDEYKDFSKDGTGAFYKNKKEHKGQFVYVVDDGTPDGAVNVRPVYVFESVRKVKKTVENAPKFKRLVAYFESGCTISVTQPVPASSYNLVIRDTEKKKKWIKATTPLMPSKFLLNTIITKSQAIEAKTADGKVIVSTLEPCIKAGLHRVYQKAPISSKP
jgi:CRISPR-associated endonuclease Csn1